MLTDAQKIKLEEIKTKFQDVGVAFDNLRILFSKIEQGDDEDLALTATQISNLIGKYTDKKQALIDATKNLPII